MIKFSKDRVYPLSPELSLLELSDKEELGIQSSCGGYGTCGACRVLIKNHTDLPPRNEIEQEMASDRGFLDEERLACQTLCDRDLEVEL